jgi:hypothetical protein
MPDEPRTSKPEPQPLRPSPLQYRWTPVRPLRDTVAWIKRRARSLQNR